MRGRRDLSASEVISPVNAWEVFCRVFWGAVFLACTLLSLGAVLVGLSFVYESYGLVGPAVVITLLLVSYFSGIFFQWLMDEGMWGRYDDLTPKEDP